MSWNGALNGGGRTYSTYGRERLVAHRCGRCANPHTGGRADCPNAFRASQSVPYMDCPATVCDEETHEACWSDYDRQESERKYRPEEGGFLMGETR